MAAVSVSGGGSGGALSLQDCVCPVCLEIYIEPVTLPCTHTFCKACFQESVDKASLCCPLCRRRVSTWARLNRTSLVDQDLWTRVQTCFPTHCQLRLHGQDTPTVSVCVPRVSQPGELKQEYEEQVTKLTEERRALEAEQRRASEEFIQRLLQEEEELLQEDRRRSQEDERLARLLSTQLLRQEEELQEDRGRSQEDERVARLLSTQLNSPPVPQNSADVTPAKKKKKKEVSGHMDRFLCPLPSHSSSSSSSFIANKENILLPEPDQSGTPPPSEEQLRPGTSGGGAPSSPKRRSSEPETTTEEEESEGRGSALQRVSEWEAELLSRQRQEEEDRRLALVLQKELDQEERQRATDRSKGSADPYLLRQTTRGRDEDTPRRPPRNTAETPCSSRKTTSSTKTSPSSRKTASSTKTSPSSRGRKQATLTEMFSSPQ